MMEDVPNSSHDFLDAGQHNGLQNPQVDVCVEFFVCSKECGGIRSPSLVTTPSTMTDAAILVFMVTGTSSG